MTKLKDRLYRLIDELPPKELPVAQRFLEFLRAGGSDPVLRALAAAPYDDEPFTKADEAAVAEAREEMARGEGVPHAAVLRRRRR